MARSGKDYARGSIVAIEQARPFLKWAGGKSALAPQIIERIPTIWDRKTDLYVEPFVGAGAVFFALQPKRALLNDANVDLMNAWGAVQYLPDGLTDALERRCVDYRENPEQIYYAIRSGSYGASTALGEAANFIFLNKTCFNGLYRVNANGDFNVPWGKNPNVNFPTLEHLQCCSAVLQGAQLLAEDFAAPAFLNAFDPKGALIYCDPPYVPVSKTANFTSYTADGFPYVAQLHLVVQAAYWRGCGAHVILSQAAEESLIEQYRRVGFRADLVRVNRSINSKGDKRAPVGEYIIY